MKNDNFNYDLIVELKKIIVPIPNKNGKPIIFSEKPNKREAIFKHTALKRHRLKIRDIREIPNIIKNPIKIQNLKKCKNRKAYYGNRPGQKQMKLILIIATYPDYEKIITFYPIKKFL